MLSVQNVTVSFGGETLFNEISFRLGAGDRVGLVGKNGAGKSTLLHLIARDNEPTSGAIAPPTQVIFAEAPVPSVFALLKYRSCPIE